MQKNKEYFVVIPAYNEDKNLKSLLLTIKKQGYASLVVDDGSTDNTFKIANRYANITIKHDSNLGKGAAMRTGCDYIFTKTRARGIVLMDADGQHLPREIPLFTTELSNGHDLIFGIRSLDSRMPLARVIGNKFLSFFINIFFGAYIPDILSGYKAISRYSYEIIRWESCGYEVETEIAARAASAKLDFITLPIMTIYHGFDRGMRFVDALWILFACITWKLKFPHIMSRKDT